MNEEQQIEEMAKIYCKTEFLCNKGCQREGCRIYEICDTLYNAGYRKVPDGATVLLVGKYNQALDEKTIEYFIKHNEQIRKETVIEFAEKLKEEFIKSANIQDSITAKKLFRDICPVKVEKFIVIG